MRSSSGSNQDKPLSSEKRLELRQRQSVRYLTSVLANIASMPVSQVERLLPDVWNRDDLREHQPADASPN
ncbi:MAG: hypothetical protein IT440_09260 [Phycisphaeraceae bacterium]|nr:hypothetical protein [Phycisphaeraceae bacterium]